MRATELIEELQRQIATYGDLKVTVWGKLDDTEEVRHISDWEDDLIVSNGCVEQYPEKIKTLMIWS